MKKYVKFLVSHDEIEEAAKPIVEELLDKERVWHTRDLLDGIRLRQFGTCLDGWQKSTCEPQLLARYSNLEHIDREVIEKLVDPSKFKVSKIDVVSGGWDVTCLVEDDEGVRKICCEATNVENTDLDIVQ